MDSQRWQRVSDLFEAALECAPGERSDLLARDAGGDEELREEVESLLATHDPDFMSTPVAVLAPDAGRALASGQSFGQYKDVSPLGEGGMGEVYLAVDTRLKRKVALKVLPSYFTHDPERVRRFEREALAASALTHPNIVTIYEIGEVDGRHFIAAEYAEGETLRGRLRRGPLGQIEALDIASQLASALEAAHAVGIVHRDIKPENVVVRPDGYVKLLDFGLAKLTDRARPADGVGSAFNMTRPGVVMGTANYMSPEQARGQEVDARADLWSLGVVLYEMVAGRAPFPGETPSHVTVAIMEGEAPPLPDDLEVSPELRRIITKALRKGREERYQTARELAGDLKRLKQGPATATSTTDAEYRAGGIDRRRRWAMLTAAALLTVVAAAAYTFYPAAGGEAIDSIAVLPFVNVGDNPSAEYLSDGISDSVINSLSQLPNLKKVISFNSVLNYKGKQVDPQQVGRELNVRAVLMGRLTKHGDEVLISTELVDVQDRRRLWGGQYNRKLADLLPLQGEIAQEISDRLRLKLTGAEKQRLAKSSTTNPEAFQLYMQGRFFRRNRAGNPKARDYLEQAIRIDPNYAPAYAQLAYTYATASAGDRLSRKEARERQERAARRALELDETLGDAHAALALTLDDWSVRSREFQRAVELDPNSADVHAFYARVLWGRRRIDEAILHMRRAVELDPLSPALQTDLGKILFTAGQRDRATEQYRKALDLNPNYWNAHHNLAKFYLAEGRYEEAIAEAEKMRANTTNRDSGLPFLGYTYAVAGKRAEAEKILHELEEESKQHRVDPEEVAMIYTGLGDKDRAFALLQKELEENGRLPVFINILPEWDSLRTDPRFEGLLRQSAWHR